MALGRSNFYSFLAVALLGFVILDRSQVADATISCGFKEEAPNNFCSWTPSAQGAQWATGVDAKKTPPGGNDKYAYIRSGVESWAILESKIITLSKPTRLSYAVIEQRFDPNGSEDFVQLHMIPVNGQPERLLWAIDNSFPGWTVAKSPLLKTEVGPFRLRFMFKVGILDNLAALGSLVLEEEASSVASLV